MIRLRACEPEDLDILYRWENDPAYRCAGELRTPYSRYALRQFILSSGQDIHETKQMRFMAERAEDGILVGAVDLFDFDPYNSRACVGILIDRPYQRQGLAAECLRTLQEYAFSQLHLHQLYAHIPATNTASLHAFEKAGFGPVALLKDWIKEERQFTDVAVVAVYRGNI